MSLGKPVPALGRAPYNQFHCWRSARYLQSAWNQKPGISARSKIYELGGFLQVWFEFMNDAVLGLISLHALKGLTVHEEN